MLSVEPVGWCEKGRGEEGGRGGREGAEKLYLKSQIQTGATCLFPLVLRLLGSFWSPPLEVRVSVGEALVSVLHPQGTPASTPPGPVPPDPWTGTGLRARGRGLDTAAFSALNIVEFRMNSNLCIRVSVCNSQ